AARWGTISDANTQPFSRAWGRREWLFVHSGSLDQRLDLGERPPFEPVGSTDTEAIFCELMSRIAAEGRRRLRDVSPQLLRDWFHGINELGVLTCALTD